MLRVFLRLDFKVIKVVADPHNERSLGTRLYVVDNSRDGSPGDQESLKPSPFIAENPIGNMVIVIPRKGKKRQGTGLIARDHDTCQISCIDGDPRMLQQHGHSFEGPGRRDESL